MLADANHLPPAVPEIPVTDLDAAVAYYRDALGFAVDWMEEELGLAGISQGACRLFLANAAFRSARGNAGPSLAWLTLDGKEAVDTLYAMWLRRGARLLGPPESKPYGLHEFIAHDLDGNQLRVFHDFATPLRESGA